MARELPPPAEPGDESSVRLDLVAMERPTALPCFGGKSLPMWTLSDGAWPPVVRLKLGQRLDASLENRLPREGEHTSIHWHGIRLPNDQDGVPYLTQQPVWPGERFDYSFVPPDTGTFFFHPHCNTVEQLGRGMAGVLIVEGDESEPYDADVPIVIRDWRIDDAGGAFLPFLTPEGAGKAGTFGTIRSANGEANPEILLPAERRLPAAAAQSRQHARDGDRHRGCRGGDRRDRRHRACPGAAEIVAARPGDARSTSSSARPPTARRCGSSIISRRSRCRSRASPGEARRSATKRFRSRAASRRTHCRRPTSITPSGMPFTFSATATNEALAEAAAEGLLIDSLCAAAGTFWAINKKVWPAGDHSRIPAPLATLTRGKSYRLRAAEPHAAPAPDPYPRAQLQVLKSNTS